ncbi:DNA cytosine methyltransferase [Enterobacter phage SDFMU_EhYP]|uniref:DNA cytosine methyltransferase n=1 Tax=Enterobacter phage SDFMU_EhYP TaxID=3076128 RepID=A0AA96KRG1_9CAUD|nr:DNA cytosine methyltransferase [Enterobacter phage SDFMU_EhYP]
MQRVIWSMFDGSGIMVKPWADAGYECYCFNYDGANHGSYEPLRVKHENIYYINCWIDDNFLSNELVSVCPMPDVIFAFPDCTEFAGSGAKHGHTGLSSLHNAKMVKEIADAVNAKWMVENPVGKMSTLWRKPDHYFHPFEYGGYLTGKEESFHPRMPAQDAYTKKTCLWVGNGFVMPEKKPVPHIGKFWGWAYLGGKSPKTKQLRSLTSRGFAQAVYLANR